MVLENMPALPSGELRSTAPWMTKWRVLGKDSTASSRALVTNAATYKKATALFSEVSHVDLSLAVSRSNVMSKKPCATKLGQGLRECCRKDDTARDAIVTSATDVAGIVSVDLLFCSASAA